MGAPKRRRKASRVRRIRRSHRRWQQRKVSNKVDQAVELFFTLASDKVKKEVGEILSKLAARIADVIERERK